MNNNNKKIKGECMLTEELKNKIAMISADDYLSNWKFVQLDGNWYIKNKLTEETMPADDNHFLNYYHANAGYIDKMLKTQKYELEGVLLFPYYMVGTQLGENYTDAEIAKYQSFFKKIIILKTHNYNLFFGIGDDLTTITKKQFVEDLLGATDTLLWEYKNDELSEFYIVDNSEFVPECISLKYNSLYGKLILQENSHNIDTLKAMCVI